MEKTIEDKIKEYIQKIETARLEDIHPNISFTIGKKVKFDDKFPIFSCPARKEIHEMMEYLSQVSPMKKYQIFEMLVLNGLKGMFNNNNKIVEEEVAVDDEGER